MKTTRRHRGRGAGHHRLPSRAKRVRESAPQRFKTPMAPPPGAVLIAAISSTQQRCCKPPRFSYFEEHEPHVGRARPRSGNHIRFPAPLASAGAAMSVRDSIGSGWLGPHHRRHLLQHEPQLQLRPGRKRALPHWREHNHPLPLRGRPNANLRNQHERHHHPQLHAGLQRRHRPLRRAADHIKHCQLPLQRRARQPRRHCRQQRQSHQQLHLRSFRLP